LDVSNCSNLEELDCQNNHLINLTINGCSKLKKINCATNKFLEEVDLNSCLELTTINSDLIYDTEKGKLVKDGSLAKNSPQIRKATNDEIRNILIVDGKKYCVIDNIGFGDNSSLAEEDILFKIGEGIHSAKEGINQ
ncbi:12874_t:CDS:2, partial [Cetraspora pellucida]